MFLYVFWDRYILWNVASFKLDESGGMLHDRKRLGLTHNTSPPNHSRLQALSTDIF
jgi:hypothetical protein